MSDKDTLGSLLKSLRIDLKATIYEIAEMINVSNTYISQIENDKKIPSNIVFFRYLYRFKIHFNRDTNFKDISDNHIGKRLLILYANKKKKSVEKLFLQYLSFSKSAHLNDLKTYNKTSSNNIALHKWSHDKTEIERPYFDLEWLITQKDFEVFYGQKYDIQNSVNEKNKGKELRFYNRLNDEDLKIIHGMIEAYISNRYNKFKRGDN